MKSYPFRLIIAEIVFINLFIVIFLPLHLVFAADVAKPDTSQNPAVLMPSAVHPITEVAVKAGILFGEAASTRSVISLQPTNKGREFTCSSRRQYPTRAFFPYPWKFWESRLQPLMRARVLHQIRQVDAAPSMKR